MYICEMKKLMLARYFEFLRLKYPSFPPELIAPKILKVNTTNGLTSALILFIKLKGWKAERISSSGRVIDNRKVVTDCLGRRRQIGSTKYIPSNSQRGTADIKATIAGREISIEVKNKLTKDRQSAEQKNYQSETELSGGVYYIATDFDSAALWIENTFEDSPNKLEFYNFWIKEKEKKQ